MASTIPSANLLRCGWSHRETSRRHCTFCGAPYTFEQSFACISSNSMHFFVNCASIGWLRSSAHRGIIRRVFSDCGSTACGTVLFIIRQVASFVTPNEKARLPKQTGFDRAYNLLFTDDRRRRGIHHRRHPCGRRHQIRLRHVHRRSRLRHDRRQIRRRDDLRQIRLRHDRRR